MYNKDHKDMIASFSQNDNEKSWIEMDQFNFYVMKGHPVMSRIIEVFSQWGCVYERIKEEGMPCKYRVDTTVFTVWSLIKSKGKTTSIKLTGGEEKKETQPCHVYLVEQPFGLVKPGKSKDFPTRLNTLETGGGMPLKPLFISILFPSYLAHKIEQRFLDSHSSIRMLQNKDLGEWVFLDRDSAMKSLLSIMKEEVASYNRQFDDGIPSLKPLIGKAIPFSGDKDLTLFSVFHHSSWEKEWERKNSASSTEKGKQIKLIDENGDELI